MRNRNPGWIGRLLGKDFSQFRRGLYRQLFSLIAEMFGFLIDLWAEHRAADSLLLSISLGTRPIPVTHRSRVHRLLRSQKQNPGVKIA
jgi:hypothetical protein